MARRYTTRHEDRDYLLERYAAATRAWAVGDRCVDYVRGQAVVVTVRRIEGDLLTLSNGTIIHRSKMTAVPKGA